MYMLTTLGEPESRASCSGWESDPESFSKRVAEHYVRTVLGQSLSARRIVPYYPSGNKKFMEVQFSPTLAVGVSFVKIPDYVIALQLRAQPPGPPRYYTYSCTPKGDLVLSERKPPSTPQSPTTLKMRGALGEAEQIAGWLGSPQYNKGLGQPPPRPWVPPPGYREPPRMGPTEPGTRYRGAITGAQILEERFRKAERSGDITGMAEAAEAYNNLLGQFPPQRPGEPMPGRGAMQQQRKRELEARDDIMRHAPTLASIVNTLASRGLPVTRRKMVEQMRQRVLARQQGSRPRR